MIEKAHAEVGEQIDRAKNAETDAEEVDALRAAREASVDLSARLRELQEQVERAGDK